MISGAVLLLSVDRAEDSLLKFARSEFMKSLPSLGNLPFESGLQTDSVLHELQGRESASTLQQHNTSKQNTVPIRSSLS